MNVVVKHKKQGRCDVQCPLLLGFSQPVGTHVAKDAGLADKEDALECCSAAGSCMGE